MSNIEFENLVHAFDDWFSQDDDEISETALNFAKDSGGLLQGTDDFWCELASLFDHASSDDESPLRLPAGADRVVLIRQHDGDGAVFACLVTFYLGEVKLATRSLERRELCTEHKTGPYAAAEALATLSAAIHQAAKPLADLVAKANTAPAEPSVAGQFSADDIECALRMLAERYVASRHDVALTEQERDVARRVQAAFTVSFAEPTIADRIAEWGITAEVAPHSGRKLLNASELDAGLRAWSVTLTLDGKTFDVVTVMRGDEPPTVVDALTEARANAVSFREYADDRDWLADEEDRAELTAAADAFLAWLGDERFTALLDETEEPLD